MIDLDALAELGTSLRANKLRTLLTAAGVFWGMFMLVVMLGFGNGLERAVAKGMGGFGSANAVYMWGQRTSLPYRGLRPGRWFSFDNSDIAALQAVPGVAVVCPRNQLGGWRDGLNVERNGKTGNYTVMGDVPEYRLVQGHVMTSGRFLDPLDLDDRRKVAVIGKQVVSELFRPDEDPVGQAIEIRGVWFRIVGTFASSRADDEGDRQNGTIHVPFTTFQHAWNVGDRVGWFALLAREDVSGSELEDRARAVLLSRHRADPADVQAVGAFNAEEEFRKVRNLFAGIRAFVWFVGTMTLLAGVVGVSNILLIVVRERTREIGLRRAIGATPSSIVAMIVQEAVLLVSAAGYGGLVAGVAALELVARIVGDDNDVLGAPTVDLGVAAVAGAVLLVAGVLAGFLPARRAASISPVDALRSE